MRTGAFGAYEWCTRPRLPLGVLGLVILVLVSAPASPAHAVNRFKSGADRIARHFDVRDALRSQLTRRSTQLRAPSRASRDARRALARRLGRHAIIDIDPLTGTPRRLADADHPLSDPKHGGPVKIAWRYIRANLPALGLTKDDLKSLRLADHIEAPGGVHIVRWRQYVDGIPALDNELKVIVTRDGRVLAVLGGPQHNLRADTTPDLTARQALDAFIASLGEPARALGVRSVAPGPQRLTVFTTGDTAELAIFGEGIAARLVWHISYQAGAAGSYDAAVDADTGAVVRRINLLKSVDADVWSWYPGAPRGGTAQTISLDPWLTPGAGTLTGPNAHAFSDLNDNNTADGAVTVTGVGTVSEEIAPGRYAFQPFTSAQNPDGACAPSALCSWADQFAPSSWTVNRRQNAVQAFALVNRFHDYLRDDPSIGFDADSGNFEGADAVSVNTIDGAATAGNTPNSGHLNNANMTTPPDGRSPTMQMYLFTSRASGIRSINSGDDAVIVYHEYTHGLSSRLITDAAGVGTLNSDQSGALGEALSDYYAFDFLASTHPGADTDADGELYLGQYAEEGIGGLRSAPIDCSVGSTELRCAGSSRAGSGGYTFGDFARILGTPEVHADSEIIAQTLWDLRRRVGVTAARALVTTGMRFAPPEPSFLDLRDAFLLADQALTSGTRADAIWSVAAERGMGYFAGAADSSDTTPTESFSTPPTEATPRGQIAGRVTDAASGLPLAGVTVTVAPDSAGEISASTAANGTYAIAGVPAGSYAALATVSQAGYDPVTRPVTVTAGQVTTVDTALQRNWASTAGGAVNYSVDADLPPSWCTTAWALDQDDTTSWAEFNPDYRQWAGTPSAPPDPQMLVELPQVIAVTGFAIDPSVRCLFGGDAPTREILIETAPSRSGPFTVAFRGTFAAADLGRLNLRTPTGGTTGVKVVRVTLLAPLAATSADVRLIHLAGFSVFGAPAGTVPPGGTPGPVVTPAPPPSPPPAAPPAAPSNPLTPAIAVKPVRRGVRISLGCDSPCSLDARLAIAPRTAKRVGLPRRTAVRTLRRPLAAGTHTVSLKLSPKAVKKLLGARVRRAPATITVAALDGEGQATRIVRRIRLRI